MQLKKNDLYILSQCATAAALRAGNYISNNFNKNTEVKNKLDLREEDSSLKVGTSLASQVVTEVDYKSQEIILDTLKHTLKEYNLALLTEESADDGSRFQKDYFWCIDPLDGTLPFTEQKEGYSVCIALVSKEGEAIIGVVYDPYNDVLYHAIKGQGAYINNRRVKINYKIHNKISGTFHLVVDRSFFNDPRYSETVKHLEEFILNKGYDNLDVINWGGAAMNACLTLERGNAVYFKYPKPQTGGGSIWDYAATACIFKEAGAIASDIYGNPLDLNSKTSTFMNHRGILYSTDTEISEYVKSLI